MKIELKTMLGDVIIEGDFTSVAEAIKAALAAKKSLSSADLRSADLRSADLRSADLSSADLSSADLSSADLRYADLSSADLSSADLRYADLSYADLRSADLSYADLRSAKNSELAIARTRILPAGDLIGWKKLEDGVIAQLRIPEAAPRSHAFGRKCRAGEAVVLAMFQPDGTAYSGVGLSCYRSGFEYRVGETVKPGEPFSPDWTNECASGIHFYITREEAAAHT